MKPFSILDWLLRVLAAGILAQTLFFKFTGAEESVLLFTELGVEPYGRIGLGIVELIACALLLIPRTAWMGCLLAVGVLTGAIMTHLFIIGIVFNDDGGLLFGLALVGFIAAALGLFIHREKALSFFGLKAQST